MSLLALGAAQGAGEWAKAKARKSGTKLKRSSTTSWTSAPFETVYRRTPGPKE